MAEQQKRRTVGPVTLASAGGGSVLGVSVAQLISGLVERGGEPLSDGLVYAITILATAAFGILGGWLMPSQREALHAQAAKSGKIFPGEEYLALIDEVVKVIRSARIPEAPVATDAKHIDHHGQPVETDVSGSDFEYGTAAHVGGDTRGLSDPGPRP
ncbi:hypothetical protein NBM05_08495 [Rothia sp. AR01]|uniref:Uncharacterized protein n=1 Tax=Rothia santali TaxID=2949643 RepID=A0A9X2KII0_9MICC|nr:hypothetical protein [Rothia santali]MCP3426040.1 hypothetical protein [Rothia santali]